MKTIRKTIMMMSAILAFSCAPEQKNDMFDIPQDGYTFFEADFQSVDFDAEAEQEFADAVSRYEEYSGVDLTNMPADIYWRNFLMQPHLTTDRLPYSDSSESAIKVQPTRLKEDEALTPT